MTTVIGFQPLVVPAMPVETYPSLVVTENHDCLYSLPQNARGRNRRQTGDKGVVVLQLLAL